MRNDGNVIERARAILTTTAYRHVEFERTSRGTYTLHLRDDPLMPSTSLSQFLGIASPEEQARIDEICDDFNFAHGIESSLYERARKAIRLTTYRMVKLEVHRVRRDVVVLIFTNPSKPSDPPEAYLEFEYGKIEFDTEDYRLMATYRTWLRNVCEWHNAIDPL